MPPKKATNQPRWSNRVYKKKPKKDERQLEEDACAIRAFFQSILPPSFNPQTVSIPNTLSDRPNVHLNVYDVTCFNLFLSFTGVGLYHSGVIIGDKEWAFRKSSQIGSGVFTMPPGDLSQLSGTLRSFRFKETVSIGQSRYSARETEEKVQTLSAEWLARDYRLLTRNCNCYTENVCQMLCGVSIPSWINRAATMGAPLSFLWDIMPDVFSSQFQSVSQVASSIRTSNETPEEGNGNAE